MKQVIKQYGMYLLLSVGPLMGCSKGKTAQAPLYEVYAGGWKYQCSPQLIAGKVVGNLLIKVTLVSPDPSQDPLRYGVSSLEEYNARVQYFLSEAQQEFDLVLAGGKTIPTASYYFENSYNLTPSVQFVVGFELPQNVSDKPVTLEYEDHIFNTGLIKFRFTPTDYLRPAKSS